MRHPTEGVLRRLLDEPAGVAYSDREHVSGCAQCLHGLGTMRDDATLVEAALTPEASEPVDVAAAWRRLSTSSPARGPGRAAAQTRAGRLRGVMRRPAIAAVAVAAVLAGAGTAAANDWLQIFRTERIAPVSLDTTDLLALPDLSDYGDVDVTREADVRQVPDEATAEAQTGLDVPEVATLPRGVVGEPAYSVGDKVSATFTFSTGQAEDAASQAGEALPPVPPGLEGSQVRLVAGPGVAQTWTSSAGVPALFVGRAVAPSAMSSGVAFETVGDYLLSLPGLPADIAAQLRTYTSDGSTLPLPVPADQVTTSPAQVNGMDATVLATRDRTLGAVVWVDDGEVTVVAGSLDADELLSVAGSLR
jgi:hypothetical protein